MKKLYLILILLNFSFAGGFAQCTIDPGNTEFFSPRFDSLPCIERTVDYNQVVQISIPDSLNLQSLDTSLPFAYYLHIDSVVITSVTGFPTSITYALNPPQNMLYGGTHACAVISGTTTDTPGTYIVVFQGTMTMHGAPFPPFFSGDTTINLQAVESNPQAPFHAFVTVINTGGFCTEVNGIKHLNSELNALLSVYPNPNNGAFELKLNAGGRLNGEIVIMDVDGRVVYSNKLDAMGIYETSIDLSKVSKGLYTLQLRTANGFASKKISVE